MRLGASAGRCTGRTCVVATEPGRHDWRATKGQGIALPVQVRGSVGWKHSEGTEHQREKDLSYHTGQ